MQLRAGQLCCPALCANDISPAGFLFLLGGHRDGFILSTE
jgi:hypothetical protein